MTNQWRTKLFLLCLYSPMLLALEAIEQPNTITSTPITPDWSVPACKSLTELPSATEYTVGGNTVPIVRTGGKLGFMGLVSHSTTANSCQELIEAGLKECGSNFGCRIYSKFCHFDCEEVSPMPSSPYAGQGCLEASEMGAENRRLTELGYEVKFKAQGFTPINSHARSETDVIENINERTRYFVDNLKRQCNDGVSVCYHHAFRDYLKPHPHPYEGGVIVGGTDFTWACWRKK